MIIANLLNKEFNLIDVFLLCVCVCVCSFSFIVDFGPNPIEIYMKNTIFIKNIFLIFLLFLL